MKRLVVIGNGMAACRLLEELTRLAPDLYQITVVGEEPFAGYNRVMLSPLLGAVRTSRPLPPIPTSGIATGIFALSPARRWYRFIAIGDR